MQFSLSVFLITHLGHHVQHFTDERTTTSQMKGMSSITPDVRDKHSANRPGTLK